MVQKILAQGAEAKIILDKKKIIKSRIKKSYRIPELDKKIRKLRTRGEAKILKKLSGIIPVPEIIKEDERNSEIIMGFIEGKKLSEHLDKFSEKEQKEIMKKIGKDIAKLHKENIIHGDLTTSNMILSSEGEIYLIDFGLSFQNGKYEDKAVDLHLLKQALEAKHFQNWKNLYEEFEKTYLKENETEAKKILERLKAVEKRGRYKH